ncbi:family 43 glycosylhydrolase [uncultured Sphingomonas sp.]|uniref:family 43 glycosylhydrolase n=1 Tax=uncultured Sphingomonas sp. TaxID=158754 RepID=UPI0035CBB380
MNDPTSLTRRTFIAATGVAAATAATAQRRGRGVTPGQPLNPVVRRRADTQIFRHTDGNYYMTASVPEYDRLVLRRSRTLAGLATARETVLWRHLASGPLSGFIWAPELHRIDGRWIMYFAAGPSGGGEDVFRIRTYALVCDGPDPMTGRWRLLGQLTTPWDSFTLDSTSFVHRGVRYLLWAQKEPGIDTNSNLYLAPLKTPITLAAAPARLTVPTLDWEIRGFKVAEGATVLPRNGRLFMTYSASATDDRYCLGLLTCADDADIMQPSNWTKSPKPVFVSSDATSVYGPGHNSFTVDEQGRDVLVYHGRDYKAIKGDPLFDPNRDTRIQRIYYRADGTPDFGIPVGNGPLPYRMAPAGRSGAFLRLQGDRFVIGSGPLASTQIRQVPGKGGTIAFEPIERRGQRLCHDGAGRVVLARDDGTPGFAARSSFVAIGQGRDRQAYRLVGSGGLHLQAAGDEVRIARGMQGASFLLS